MQLRGRHVGVFRAPVHSAAAADLSRVSTFERYGVPTLQTWLTSEGHIRHEGNLMRPDAVAEHSLLPWLTEQYDRAERKETLSLTMEAAITIFVAAELMLPLIRFLGGH